MKVYRANKKEMNTFENHNILDLKPLKMLNDKDKSRNYPWGRL